MEPKIGRFTEMFLMNFEIAFEMGIGVVHTSDTSHHTSYKTKLDNAVNQWVSSILAG